MNNIEQRVIAGALSYKLMPRQIKQRKNRYLDKHESLYQKQSKLIAH